MSICVIGRFPRGPQLEPSNIRKLCNIKHFFPISGILSGRPYEPLEEQVFQIAPAVED